jgi:hypothetical protein
MDDHLGILQERVEAETVGGVGPGWIANGGAAKFRSRRKKTCTPARIVEA